MSLPVSAFPLLKPLLLNIEPEYAHHLTLALLRLWQPQKKLPALPSLKIELWGLHFSSPLGLAAGFDKNGIVIEKTLALGFGFVEIGTLTPKAQTGNPRPRVFRLDQQKALCNHLGFPNLGIHRFIKRSVKNLNAVGINISANANSLDYISDYIFCIEQLEAVEPAYIALNVSSPNTENLRRLEQINQLAQLLDRINTKHRILIKLSPDMEDSAYRDIATLALEKKLAGIIATNTSIKHDFNRGGLSGRPLCPQALHITALLYQAVDGRLPIIGVGGITSGEQAYQRICAGASLIQLYTALTFHGPRLVAQINHDLAWCLQRDGFNSVAQAIGSNYN